MKGSEGRQSRRAVLLGGASAGGDRVLKLWDVATGKVVRDLRIRGIHAVAFSPDGGRVLANDSEKIILFEGATGKVLRTFTGHSENVSSLPLRQTVAPRCPPVGTIRSSSGIPKLAVSVVRRPCGRRK